MKYAIARVFAKRVTKKSTWSGRIGSVEGSADIASFILNGTEVPAASVGYLLNFSLQSLQDAYAGSDSLDEATGFFDKKLAALLAGTIGIRAGGGRLTDEENAELYIARITYEVTYAKGTEKGDAFRALNADDEYEFLVDIIAKLREQMDDFDDRVAQRVEDVNEERARKAAEKAKKTAELAAIAATAKPLNI